METLSPRLGERLDKDVYPEFIKTIFQEQLKAILARISPDLFIPPPFRPAYANSCGCNGAVKVVLISRPRVFRTEISRCGITIGVIDCTDINEVAEVFATWLTSRLSTEDARRLWPEAKFRDDAELYEVTDSLDQAWNIILYLDGGTSEPFLRECAKIPILRGLMPVHSTTMNALYFSRCTGYPYTDDCPVTFPMKDGRYNVSLPDKTEHIVTGAKETAQFVARHLPVGTTRAFEGSSNEMNQD